MKIFFYALILLCLGSCEHSPLKTKMSFAKAKATQPVELVFDDSLKAAKPVNFRKSEELKMSGSANFSEKAAKAIAKLAEVVTVFDLNQESHGLVNGIPVTWSAEKNWANADLNHEEAVNREKRYLSELRIGGKLGKIKIKSIETEESLVRGLGHNYVRLTITDHVRPSDEEVDRFVDSVRELPTESWIHFHCRTGSGRTTLFMTMFDMLQSAQNKDFETIVARNRHLSGEDNILFLSDDGDWLHPFQEDQIRFLKEFYEYAKAHPRGDKVLWTQRGGMI